MMRKIFTLFLIVVPSLIHNSIFAQQKDIVNGNLIQFNDNGFWCWFQDERAVVDTVKGKLVIGSAACGIGVGGSTRSSTDEVEIYDLETNTPVRYKLGDYSSSSLTTDDHNAPGLLIRPDGKYIAMYSDHYDRYKNRYRIFDGSTWSTEKSYDWTKRPGGTDYTIAYNNVYYLSSENKMYDFSRANHRTPNFIESTDLGDTWAWGGQLSTNTSDSYNKGYYKYWGNGVDRIDFICTEQHPRDTLTSIYHGYIKDGKVYNSDGVVVDNDITDTTFIPSYWNFTKVFSNGTEIGSNTFYRCWPSDLVRYADGTIAAIISARINQSYSPLNYQDSLVNPDHAFIYCRFDGKSWSYTFLDKAGYKFYSAEADYVGLGALCPNDPNTLFISTSWDPRDTTKNLRVREIFKGVTADNGVKWNWSPITENSTRDNMRPIVPAWNNNNSVLLWCRGSYISAQTFDAAVVGIIFNKNENVSKMIYTDASSANTTFADGTALVTTGPNSSAGAIDSKWNLRTGVGNESTVLASSDSAGSRGTTGENCPTLKTTISVPQDGTYDVWVNFWGDTTADWRVKAGFSSTTMQIFRQMACKQVTEGSHSTKLVLSGEQNSFLYQGYVGRVKVAGSKNIDVFIDDEPYKTGTTTLTGNTVRTWYDGISYALINDGFVNVVQSAGIPVNFKLEQNYPNPFNPSTTINYRLSKASNVTLKIYDVLGREITTLVNTYQKPGIYSAQFSSVNSNAASGIYFYTLRAGSFIQTKKMLLIK
jgi:hypothetical protein